MELTNEEKINIVTQHIRGIVTNIYSLQVSLIIEQAVDIPNQTNIDRLTLEIAQENLRHDALMSELESLRS
jgi:hypothetical protein